MRPNLDAATRVELAYEGDYVNHPKDPGGPTRWGITLAALAQHRRAPVTADDVRALGQDEAISIYEAVYAPSIMFDSLPTGLDLFAYDSAINMGRAHTVQFLQRVLGLVDDGVVGPATLNAVGTILAVGSIPALIADVRVQREAFYRKLSTFPTFGHGWMNRLDAVESKAINWSMAGGPT